MDASEEIILKKRLQSYYENYFSPAELLKIVGLDNFPHLEFACFGFPYMKMGTNGKEFKKSNSSRKNSFQSPNQVGKWLANFSYYNHPQGPAYKGYFGARFVEPFTPAMDIDEFQDLTWESHDLCSDIDIDGSVKIRQDNCQCHGKTICNNCLEIAKEAIIHYVETLDEDFGYSKNNVYLCFSGREGFHIHYPTHTNLSPNRNENQEREIRRKLIEYMRFVEEFVKKESGKRKEQALPEDIDIRLKKNFGKNRFIHSETMRIRIETTIAYNFWRYTPFDKMLSMTWKTPEGELMTDIDRLKKALGKLKALMLKNPNTMLERTKKDGKSLKSFLSHFGKTYDLDYVSVLTNVIYYRYPRYDPNPAFDTRRIMKIPMSVDASSIKKYLVQPVDYAKIDEFTLDNVMTLDQFVK